MSKPGKQGPEFSHDREFKVVLEDLRGQFRVFGEGLQDVRKRLGHVEGGISEMKEDIQEVKREIYTMKSSTNRFFEQLSDHETRIHRLEKADH